MGVYYATILAGGLSERMGYPKVRLLMPNGEPVVKVMCQMLNECSWKSLSLVVSNENDREWIKGVLSDLGSSIEELKVLLNPEPKKGMISSLRLAIRHSPPGSLGILSWPIDHPLVMRETLLALRAQANFASVVVPVHHGHRGHPTWWGKSCWSYLESSLADEGASRLLRLPDLTLVEVETEDPSVLWNIDTPQEARAHGLKFSPEWVWKSRM